MGRTVLIVDDDDEFRALAALVLARWGHLVVAAVGTAGEGLAASEGLRPDVALVDVGLPDLDGLALARRLREGSHPPAVILVSADAAATTSDAARRAGAVAFVAKQDLTDAATAALLVANGG